MHLDPIHQARAAFLDDDHVYGCAETSFLVLKSAFGVGDPHDTSAAMALNGGIAWSGGPCGAVTGAALAVGMLAEQRIPDHARAKRVARELVARLMDEFARRHGSLDCRQLIGIDLRAPGGHDAFLAGDAWRETCMRQIEFVIGSLAGLVDADAWDAAVHAIEAPAVDEARPAVDEARPAVDEARPAVDAARSTPGASGRR